MDVGGKPADKIPLISFLIPFVKETDKAPAPSESKKVAF